MKARAQALQIRIGAAARLPMMQQASILPSLLSEYAAVLVEVAAQIERLNEQVTHIADIIAQAP